MEDLTFAPGTVNPLAALKAALGQLRVLVAEDHPLNRQLCLSMLRKLGCMADCANDGREVLQAVDLHPYDLVFMDCHMPEMDGIEATQAIRERERAAGNTRRTHIVALTADALPSNRARCMAAGMDDFISKPFSSAQLQKAMYPALPRMAAVSDEMPNYRLAIDNSRLEELCEETDRPSIVEMARMFIEELPARYVEFQELLDIHAFALLRSRAHSLKGIAASMGAMELQSRSERLEALAHGANAALVAEELPLTEAAGRRASAALKVWIDGQE